MPSKKRKYNARFPAGRIKKIMQTDEEIGKVAQAVPIIISRTLELFVASLLKKAMQVTISRNAKTLSPSHVKQCILAESRFDFLRDLVKNIPDVSAAEEKEMMSAESSPNSSRFSDASAPPRRVAREDSNSSSSSDVRIQQIIQGPRENLKRCLSVEGEAPKQRIETVTSSSLADAAIDLTKRPDAPVRTANFYQETLVTDELQHRSVITVNPTYTTSQPSTSSYVDMTPVEPVQKVEVSVPKPEQKPLFYLDVSQNSTPASPALMARTPGTPGTPGTPITPILNIDFTKNITKPEFKVLDTAVPGIAAPKENPKLQRQHSRSSKVEVKKVERKAAPAPTPMDGWALHINSCNLQIDEDYDT